MAKDNGFWKALADTFMKSTFANVKRGAEDFMQKAHRNVLVLEERMMEKLLIFGTMLLAVIFFVVAAMFYMLDRLLLSRDQVFFIVAAILLVIGFFLKYRSMRAELRR